MIHHMETLGRVTQDSSTFLSRVAPMELLLACTGMLSEHCFNSGARDLRRTTTPGGRIDRLCGSRRKEMVYRGFCYRARRRRACLAEWSRV